MPMMNPIDISRRSMLRGAAGAAIVSTAASCLRVIVANERFQLGLIGCGARGQGVIEIFVKTDRVDLKGVCDVWTERAEQIKTKLNANAAIFDDHRKMLDSLKTLDAVYIATPD